MIVDFAEQRVQVVLCHQQSRVIAEGFAKIGFRALVKRRAQFCIGSSNQNQRVIGRHFAGGITEGVRIGAIASAYTLRLAPHLWSGAPAFAAGVALAASQSAGFILEYSLGANPLLHELIHETFAVVDGQLEVPDRPGLGIVVDEGFVRRHARQ